MRPLQRARRLVQRLSRPLLGSRPSRQLEHYLIRERSYFERDGEVRARFGSPDNPGFQGFVDTEAVLYLREMQEVAVPFPPSTEMLTVGGETDLRKFLTIGHGCYDIVKRHLPRAPGRQRLLDFGVGCARTMRFFFRDLHQFECHGCDVDRAAIAYLKAHVPFVHARACENRPPLPYPTAFFDAVYCISVFTHLAERAFDAWMAEMRRVLRPGGVLITSLHGRTAYRQVSEEPDRRRLIGIVEEEFQRKRHAFDEQGFLWLSQPAGSADIDTNQYGCSFLRDERTAHRVSATFELETYLPGALGGWQDLAIMRPRSP